MSPDASSTENDELNHSCVAFAFIKAYELLKQSIDAFQGTLNRPCTQSEIISAHARMSLACEHLTERLQQYERIPSLDRNAQVYLDSLKLKNDCLERYQQLFESKLSEIQSQYSPPILPCTNYNEPERISLDNTAPDPSKRCELPNLSLSPVHQSESTLYSSDLLHRKKLLIKLNQNQISLDRDRNKELEKRIELEQKLLDIETKRIEVEEKRTLELKLQLDLKMDLKNLENNDPHSPHEYVQSTHSSTSSDQVLSMWIQQSLKEPVTKKFCGDPLEFAEFILDLSKELAR